MWQTKRNWVGGCLVGTGTLIEVRWNQTRRPCLLIHQTGWDCSSECLDVTVKWTMVRLRIVSLYIPKALVFDLPPPPLILGPMNPPMSGSGFGGLDDRPRLRILSYRRRYHGPVFFSFTFLDGRSALRMRSSRLSNRRVAVGSSVVLPPSEVRSELPL